MEKILVTTDMSANSRAAIRYALHLAEMRGAELIFIHVHYVLRASTWSDKLYADYIQRIGDNLLQDATSFVKSVARTTNTDKKDYSVVVYHSLDTVKGIIQYANDNKCSYICISSLGGGTIKKLMGSNTADLVAKSNVPVLCVPSAFRFKNINHILYASDLNDYANELDKVIAFAKPLNVSVDMLHLSYSQELKAVTELIELGLHQKFEYNIDMIFKERNLEHSILEEIEEIISRKKSTLLVMFTNQHRSVYEKIFLSSKAKEFAFHAKIVLLSFNKATP